MLSAASGGAPLAAATLMTELYEAMTLRLILAMSIPLESCVFRHILSEPEKEENGAGQVTFVPLHVAKSVLIAVTDLTGKT